MSQPKNFDEYRERVESLRPPTRLTDGLELDTNDAARTEKAIREVNDKGFAIVEGFLDPERLKNTREAMESVFEQTGSRDTQGKGRYSGIQTVHVHNLFAKTRAVDDIAIDPLLLFILEGVLGENFQLSVATAMCPDPGVDPQGMHQDDGHYPIPRPRMRLLANTLVALDDFTRANGATRVVPGSHEWTRPVEQDVETDYAEMPAGSLLVFDGALWHSGGGNQTKDQRRRSINLNFNLSWLRQQENLYLGLERDVWLSLPERLQRLLGLRKANFLYGSVDYMDPLDYLKTYG